MKKIALFIIMAGIVLTSCTTKTIDDLVPVAEDTSPMVVTYRDVKFLPLTGD